MLFIEKCRVILNVACKVTLFKLNVANFKGVTANFSEFWNTASPPNPLPDRGGGIDYLYLLGL